MGGTAATPEVAGASSDAPIWTVHQGDARDSARVLSAASAALGADGRPFLQATITSPPYATLVDYGSDNQIGFGQSYTDYLASCKAIFAEIFEWTLDSGSMWIVADSFLAKRANAASRFVPLPFELAAQAESVGWTLREVVIWRKDRTRPWSHPGKLRNGFEYVLLFVKSRNFKFHVDRLRETSSLKSWWVKYPERHNPWGMTPDNVWDIPIPIQGSWADSSLRHACPFPPELVRRMLALSTDEGDVVFDPFAGSGTVVTTAATEGRRALGIELNPEYVEAFANSPAPAEHAPRRESSTVAAMTQRLLELRMLKYPKELLNQALRAGFTSVQIRSVLMSVQSVNWKPSRSDYAAISCSVVVDDSVSEIERARLSKVLAEAVGKAPLSKYGLQVDWSIVPLSAAFAEEIATDPDLPMAVYTRGRTWYAAASMASKEIPGWLRKNANATTIPIVSALHVHQTLEESS